MSWNYRIGRFKFKYEEALPEIEAFHDKLKFPDTFLYSIISVHYDENGGPKSYSLENNILKNYESTDDLELSVDYIKSGFSKPIFDLDNWPNTI